MLGGERQRLERRMREVFGLLVTSISCAGAGVCVCTCTRVRMCVRRSVMSDSLQPHGLYELNLEKLTELYILTIYVLFVLYIIYINKKLYT